MDGSAPRRAEDVAGQKAGGEGRALLWGIIMHRRHEKGKFIIFVFCLSNTQQRTRPRLGICAQSTSMRPGHARRQGLDRN